MKTETAGSPVLDLRGLGAGEGIRELLASLVRLGPDEELTILGAESAGAVAAEIRTFGFGCETLTLAGGVPAIRARRPGSA